MLLPTLQLDAMLVQHVAACGLMSFECRLSVNSPLLSDYHIDPFAMTGAASSISPARSIFSTMSIFELVNALNSSLKVSLMVSLDVSLARTSFFQSLHPAYSPAHWPDPGIPVPPVALLLLSSSRPSYYVAL
jgi:hypothetical protein